VAQELKPIVADAQLVAYCGLYCGACGAYRRGRCPGCHENAKATWCTIRTCCRENAYGSCGDCKKVAEPNDCKKFNNWISKIFGLIFRSNRRACVLQIRQKGLQGHAEAMAAAGRHSMKR
jgi:hypothetical protein